MEYFNYVRISVKFSLIEHFFTLPILGTYYYQVLLFLLFLIVKIFFNKIFNLLHKAIRLLRIRRGFTKLNARNRSISPRNIIFISELSQICNTRISIQERDANGINSFQSQCLTSALTSFIRFAEQKWIRASCSGCQRDPSETLSLALPKSSFPRSFYGGCLAGAEIFPNQHFSVYAAFLRRMV